MREIVRRSYLDIIEKYIGKETIIVLVGQRRVGKSCMLQIVRDNILLRRNDDGIVTMGLRQFLMEENSLDF